MNSLLIAESLEANAYYSMKHLDPFAIEGRESVYAVIAEAFLMRSETLTKGE